MEKDISKLKKALASEKKFLKMQEEKESEKRTVKQLQKELVALRFKRQNPTLSKIGMALKKGGQVVGKGAMKLADNLEKSAKIDAELKRKRMQGKKPYRDTELEKLMYGK